MLTRVVRKAAGLLILTFLSVALLAACDYLPSSGPSTSEVTAGARPTATGGTRFALIDVDAAVVNKMETWSAASLQGTFGQQRPASGQVIGVGDYVQVVIWEAAAGGLFSAPATQIAVGGGSRSATIPEQVVGPDGAITVPYAGRVRVSGRTPEQIEQAIVAALQGKAIEPQALVTVTKNIANTVTVVSELTGGSRVPLTTRGDRILDVVATSGGTKAPPHETFVTLVREGRSLRIPMQAILSNPAENVFVRPGDVISIARETQTFTAAGATGLNSVVPFDAMGINLDQAIARAGGLNDQRSDPSGVFVIRYEPAADYDQLGFRRPDAGSQSQVPTIYRVNMRDPNGFFLTRRFPIRNKDILYVSNAPVMEVQKVIAIILPFVGVGATAVGVAAVARQ
ncbi:capsular polysaccharide biosynthesis protein [Spirochaetia bacterium]|nr:capsular polysaccharide biosynthesis protein [Spirochaetia bacterium]